ncbi:ELO family [Piptocephalis cylindrospora]|uniref:Elongation of fatty acids protein n=1 Tax=Piptocephalis cylindrospora TaxID=1907219 RepID=A0A4P9Y680_9FUNG|nr:ELO family [Piptocephalis cylindrospora]|eukprot:RKP14578.1 ELO family [Piptocephalis cylindrospora]
MSFGFSLEQPWGVNLDSFLTVPYKMLTGQEASDFKFVTGVTPLSTPHEVVISCVLYLAVIFGGQFLMRRYVDKPFRLPTLSRIHNFLLTIGSALLFGLMVQEIVPIIAKHGFFYSVCDASAWTQRLEVLYYINYLFKYYELLDTVLLVLKKKPLDFLHYYHHSMTLTICFFQLQGRTTVSWAPIALNLFVHIIMYYYYLLSSFGIRVWWKKHLTTLQISQFVIDLGIIYFCTYTYWASTYYPSFPSMGTCAGTETAAFFGCFSISSYLLLFVQFFIETYQKKVDAAKDKIKSQ